MVDELPPAVREAVVERVLREVYPDRTEATVVGSTVADGGRRVAVKAHPNGYLSSAKYALVTVVDGRVTDAEACSGRDVEPMRE